MATPTASEKIYAHSPEALLLAKISSAPNWLIQLFHRFHLRRFTSRRPEWEAGFELTIPSR